MGTLEWNWWNDGSILLVGALGAGSCAMLGVFLVLRRMSLMGDAISHAVLPGLAIAFLVTQSRTAWPMFVGAVLAGALTALLTQAIARYGKVEHGAAMGVAFSILFAIGLLLLSQKGVKKVDLDPACVLYGNIVDIGLDAEVDEAVPAAAWNIMAVFGLVVLFVAAFFKELKLAAFDPTLATTLGVNASLMHYLLMIMVAVTAVASFEAVGSILVIAMLIVPAAAAHLLTDRLGVMIGLSLFLAAASAVLGHVFAFYGPGWLGLERVETFETSALMAVMTGVFFAAAITLSPRHGVIAKAVHRIRLSLNIIREDMLGLVYRWQEIRPDGGRPIRRAEVLEAVGNSALTRLALGSLFRRNELTSQRDAANGGAVLALTPTGRRRASQLVRSHRLWESYLARHFQLPPDHLHMPAERMEHFLTPGMTSELDSELTTPRRDPHGRDIPRQDRAESGAEREP